MGFTLGPHKAVKRGEKPPYCRFCATQNTRSRPVYLFSKQFLEVVFSETISTGGHKKGPKPPNERHRPYRTSSLNGGYFKNSLAARLALSAPEPPPFFLPLVLLLDLLPLEPFFEVSPDFSRYFLPSFAILSIVRPDHVPSSAMVCYRCFYPIGTVPSPVPGQVPKHRSGSQPFPIHRAD
jgi:hypothetical protein